MLDVMSQNVYLETGSAPVPPGRQTNFRILCSFCDAFRNVVIDSAVPGSLPQQ